MASPERVLGRITGDEQFREYDQIGALRGCFRARAAHFLGIAGDIADNGIELRDGDRKLIGRAGGHGNDLPPAPPWGNQASRMAGTTGANPMPCGCRRGRH